MALNSNQPNHIPSRIEKVRGGNGEVHLSGNNGRLPLSHADTPECLMEKLIMVSLGWTGERPRNNSSPPGTMKLHMASPFSALAWSVVRQSHSQWSHGIFESPDVSILFRTVKLCKTGWHQMGEKVV